MQREGVQAVTDDPAQTIRMMRYYATLDGGTGQYASEMTRCIQALESWLNKWLASEGYEGCCNQHSLILREEDQR